jgi:hypothetical protein
VPAKTTDLQIRGILVKTRDALRRKADSNGVSMSQYLIDLIRKDVEKVTVAEWIEMMRRRPRSSIASEQVQQALREAREEEDARWDQQFGLNNNSEP